MRAVLQKYIDKNQLYFRVSEFCTIVGITKQTYYRFRALGLAPREVRFPGSQVIRIPLESVDAWMDQHEHPTKAQAIAIAKSKAELRARSEIANASKQP